MRYPTAVIFVALTLVVAGAAARQDPVKVSPGVYKVLFENEQVRVLEMNLTPGQEDQTHSHPREVVYFLGAAQAQISLPDGKVVDKEIASGEVLYNEAWTHRVKNAGRSAIRAVIVELKKP